LGPDVHDVLQPLQVSSQVWADISMDFIEGLPKVGGKSVILTVVDRFSKYAHFIPLGHPYTAALVARAFFDGVVQLHGFPSSIVSDRDPVFTGHVWRDLFKCADVSLHMSTAFHPQTDGQSEVVNKVIAMYLRCVTGDRPRAWVDWLSWVEYCYNTSFHTTLRATPFEVVYGRPHRRSCHTSPSLHGPQRRRSCCATGMTSLRKYGNASFRRSSCPSGTTTPVIATWSGLSGIGCGCAFYIGPCSPWSHAPKGSSALATPGRSESWNASARWHTGWSCRREPACTTYFMWASSSATRVNRRSSVRGCLLSRMADYYRRR
jgi:hypothetical protein